MEVEKAFKKLLIKSPFYGLFCMSLPKIITREIPTLCVSYKGLNCQLCINPDFWEKHTDDEQVALLQHEVSHICFNHVFMSDSFSDKDTFNIAADAEVNSYIDNLPQSAVTPKRINEKCNLRLIDGEGTKKYYEAIKNWEQHQQQQNAQSPQKPCNGGGGGNASNSSSRGSEAAQNDSEDNNKDDSDKEEESKPEDSKEPANNSQEEAKGEPESPSKQYSEAMSEDFDSFDDHSTWREFKDLPVAVKQLVQNNINSLIKRTAEEVEKNRGTIPGGLTEIIEKLKEKRPEIFNWKAYFRRMLGSIYDVNIKTTRNRESKRFEGSAGIKHKKKVSIMVAVDTSGSVSAKELQEFFSEIDYIYKAGARVTIVECDTRINNIVEYDGKNIPEIKGRGGTDFTPSIEYYIKNKNEYASLVYFTDGYASIPNKQPSGLVWVITSSGCRQDYPGKTIYIPKQQ